MVAFQRRLIVNVSIAVIITFFIIYQQRNAVTESTWKPTHIEKSSNCPTTPPSTPYKPNKEGVKFDWSTVEKSYPLPRESHLPSGKPEGLRKIQHDFKANDQYPADNTLRERRQMVKETFTSAWRAYRSLAWMKDELAPISGHYKNNFGGWAATLVDSLDTLWIMGLQDEYHEAVTAAISIDLSPDRPEVKNTVSMFETNIRYLGGLLSAYDLSNCKDKRLLDKSMEIGEMLLAAFDTPGHMPISSWNPRLAATGQEQFIASSIAEIGSFSLEFTRLSQLTGDMRYYTVVQHIADKMSAQQKKTKLPGMWPIHAYGDDPDFTADSQFSLGGMSDSAYEYLMKMYALLGGVGRASQYRNMFSDAMETARQHLVYRPMVPDNADILIVGDVNVYPEDLGGAILDSKSQHLSCFVGGMLAMGGKMFDDFGFVEDGRKITDGCIWAYQNAPNGIMPETFHMQPCENKKLCEWNETLWTIEAGVMAPQMPLGFTRVDDPRYLLRPEAIESVFYLYRITGNKYYQDIAWGMFEQIDRATATDLANAAVVDVLESPTQQADSMESFWMAETLKYFYLIFSDPDYISLDDYVFNTEAHPFKRPIG